MKLFLFIFPALLFISCQSSHDACDPRLDMTNMDNRRECEKSLEHFEALKAQALYVVDIAETGIVCMKNLLEQQ